MITRDSIMYRTIASNEYNTLRRRDSQWAKLLAKFGLTMSIERCNYARKATSDFRPLYAFVSPMANVPPVIVEQCVVKPTERTTFGKGWTDRGRDAYVFRIPESFEKFVKALEETLTPKPGEQLEIQ